MTLDSEMYARPQEASFPRPGFGSGGSSVLRNSACRLGRRATAKPSVLYGFVVGLALGCSGDLNDPLLGTTVAAVGTVKVAACVDPAQCTTELNKPAGSLSEPYAFATNTAANGGGVWEMITTTNPPLYPSPATLNLVYGCTRNNYASWKTFNVAPGGAGNTILGDTTGVYDSIHGKTWIATLRAAVAPATGLGLMVNSNLGDPCPSSGSASWLTQGYSFMVNQKDGADHPSIVYDPVFDKKYIVWSNGFGQAAGSNLMVMMINANGSTQHWEERGTSGSCTTTPCKTCSNFGPGAGIPSAAIDSQGAVHIVYDSTQGSIKHEIFNANGGDFSCTNNVVGPVTGSGAFCSTCSNVGTYAQLGAQGSKCIRWSSTPSIAIDHNVGANVDEVVVAYDTYTPSGCPNGSGLSNETRVFTNSFGGVGTWVSTLRSCPFTWAFPRVTSSFVPGASGGTQGLFHLHVAAIKTNPVDGTIFPYDCKSTNAGATFTCTALSGPYMPAPLPGFAACYAGDYQGAAADPAHGKFFYAWGQPLTSVPPYGIKGNINDP